MSSWFAAVYLAVSCARDTSVIYQLSANVFTRVWQGSPMMDLYPVVISQPAGPLVILVDAPVSRAPNTPPAPTMWQMSSLGTSDFVPRFVFRVLFSLFYKGRSINSRTARFFISKMKDKNCSLCCSCDVYCVLHIHWVIITTSLMTSLLFKMSTDNVGMQQEQRIIIKISGGGRCSQC